MEAKKCDMCKKFYDSEDVRKHQRVKIYLEPPMNASIYATEKRIDICNECHDKIFNMIAKEVR